LFKALKFLALAVSILLLGWGIAAGRRIPLSTSSAEAYSLYRQGDDHLTAFQFAAGVAKLEQALTLDPGFAMAAAALSEGYAKLGRKADADSLADLASAMVPDVPHPVERMTIQLRLADNGCKRWIAARDSLLESLQKAAPDNLILLTGLANQAKRADDPEAAARHYRRILRDHPNFALAYNELGYLHFYRGEFTEALDMLQRYAFLTPDAANPYDSLGEVLTELGRYPEAEEQLVKALSLQSDYLPSLLNLTRVYLAQGQVAKGTGLLAEIGRQMAGTAFETRVREFAVGSYYAHQLWDDLDHATAEFIVLYPRHPKALLFRGMRLAVSSDPGLAVAVVDSFLGDWRQQTRYRDKPADLARFEALECEFRALISTNLGRYDEAAAHWSRALGLHAGRQHPHDLVPLREQFGICLLAAGRPEEALGQAGEIFALNPNHPRALVTAAEACLMLDRFQDAAGFLDRAAAVLARADPDFPLLLQVQGLQHRLADLAGS